MINFSKHWEVLSYLVSACACTLLNIVLYAVQQAVWLYSRQQLGNVLDNIICILFAYATNRAFVFSAAKRRSKAMAREFGAFVTHRLGTMLLDTAIMLVLGNLLAAQGAALMDELMQGVLSVVAHWLGRIQPSDGSLLCRHTGGESGMALPLLPSSAVQTAHGDLRYQPLQCAGTVGPCREGLFNVLVIVLNYVFSKLIIFKNHQVRYFLRRRRENINII